MNDGVLFSKHVPNASEFVYYSDSDWSTQRSTTGGTGQLAGGSIISTSRRQDCTSGSSTHAEIIAASAGTNDVLWARGYLAEIGLPQERPTPFMVDAANVITLSQNLVSSKQTRHISRRDLIIREREQEEVIAVTKVGTADNLADMFTKVLDRFPFETLRKLTMNILVRSATLVSPRSVRKSGV
jgi:hypothetical protein